MRQMFRSFVMALMLLLATVLIAEAGGWAVITLDELPDQIVAGQSFTLGFAVRQHGRTLRDDLAPSVRFDRVDTPDSFSATAKRAGDSGHYVAEITLPNAGQWNWKVDIEQFGMVTQEMEPLIVVAGAPAATAVTITPVANAMPLTAGAAGAIVALGMLVFWLKTRARWALGVVALAALIGAIGFATTGTSVAQPVAVNQTDSVVASDQAAVGRSLFIDKGCVMCHFHPAVKTSDGPFWIGAEPPQLSNGKYSAEYLQQWLKDPSKLKSDTVMPNLHLSDAEIAALNAFLGATNR